MRGDSRRGTAKRCGNLLVFSHHRVFIVPLVARVNLVGTLSGEHDGNVLMRKLCKEVERDRRGIRLWLVHVILYFRESLEALLRGEHAGEVFHSEKL